MLILTWAEYLEAREALKGDRLLERLLPETVEGGVIGIYSISGVLLLEFRDVVFKPDLSTHYPSDNMSLANPIQAAIQHTGIAEWIKLSIPDLGYATREKIRRVMAITSLCMKTGDVLRISDIHVTMGGAE